MDAYGRFFLSNRRGAYPVEVELEEGYRLLEDPDGKRALLGPDGALTEITHVLQASGTRIL
jgi:hypothetical protein